MTDNAYHAIAFTDAVTALQESGGSRNAYARARSRGNERLGPPEVAFIGERDGFFLASVSESGWPYVQFRGGPPGFVHVLDPGLIGWADFRGNQQFITAGNVAGDDRVSLFFMDYAGRRRLKLFGRLRYAAAADEPGLAARLTIPGYKARVDRVALVEVAAWDRNCPQHIPQRYTLAELGLPDDYPVPTVPVESSR
jgi:predicted pyridoxine 5'-phosphate oxidase superfamily flavin-nucleotide-binding protein